MRGRNRTNPPATISIIPTATMNACAENGNRLSKAGERYASQIGEEVGEFVEARHNRHQTVSEAEYLRHREMSASGGQG